MQSIEAYNSLREVFMSLKHLSDNFLKSSKAIVPNHESVMELGKAEGVIIAMTIILNKVEEISNQSANPISLSGS